MTKSDYCRRHGLTLRPVTPADRAAPVHDTGNRLYAILSFFLPILGLIAGAVFRKFNYIRNYKMCRKGAIIGFITIGVILAIFLLLLLLAVI